MTTEQNKSPPTSFPLPFNAEDDFVFAANDMRVADTGRDDKYTHEGETEQMAAFIARACNSHYDMLEAL